MLKLTALTLEGFKSFAAPFSAENLPGLPGRGRMTNRLALGDVTVLIGPNGAGKSVVTSFFQMLRSLMDGNFPEYVARSGYANSLLYYGAKRTPKMRILLEFRDEQAGIRTEYEFYLTSAAGDGLIVTDETIEHHRDDCGEPTRKPVTACQQLGLGPAFAVLPDTYRGKFQLFQSAKVGDEASFLLVDFLLRCHLYHFADTSENARIRSSILIDDSAVLRSDGGNLAAFLYALKSRAEMEPYYRHIVNTVQLAFPQLERFVLEPPFTNERYTRLNWISRADDGYLQGSHQISDGALRFIALATLLLQPPDRLPKFIVLDEPELGLHPAAIELLAEMIKGMAHLNTQILVATQSPQLVNYFDLSQIRPIEHRGGRSIILELDPDAYKDWLEEYSTGELWEKNIIGGGSACA